MIGNQEGKKVLIAEKLINDVVEETGLNQFGPSPMREGLDILVKSLNEEANLNDMGKIRAEFTIKAALKYRLKIDHYLEEHPEISEQKVEKPVFIVGLPRTGTTALHHMLNQDPANHTLRLWEGQHPVPPPEDASYTTDKRIERTRKQVAMTESLLPGFFKTHLLEAEAPDECYMLFNRNFMSVEYSAMYHIPSYANWLYEQDLSNLYAYHKKQLQLLQSKKSGSWVLKCPYHQMGLRAILEHYPDAIIVQTHRSPKSFVGSGCSFSELLRKSCSDKVEKETVGSDWMEMLKFYTETFERDREELSQIHGEQILDIFHDEFVVDPWPGIKKIYEVAGRELSEEAKNNMQNWLDANPKGKHGKHEYKLEDYGLSDEKVRDVFSSYAERYGLKI